jgi:hypothetical protein
MNEHYCKSHRFAATGATLNAILALIAAVSVPAHAEYRCGSPSLQEDRRACELAKRDAPDDLRRFIQRTSSIYGLFFYDYVSGADFNRWEAVRRAGSERSMKAVDGRSGTSKAVRADGP